MDRTSEDNGKPRRVVRNGTYTKKLVTVIAALILFFLLIFLRVRMSPASRPAPSIAVGETATPQFTSSTQAEIEISASPSALPSASPSSTATASVTPHPTSTATSTDIPTVTASSTTEPTATRASTGTPTITATSTPDPTSTATATITPSPTPPAPAIAQSEYYAEDPNAPLKIAGTALPNAQVQVYREPLLLGAVTADTSGNWELTLDEALDAGEYVIFATIADADSGSIASSERITLTVAAQPTAVPQEVDAADAVPEVLPITGGELNMGH